MIGRALRLTAAATAVAGLVGVARHRRDTQRVRRGQLPAATAVADLDPVREPGPLGARLAAWVPAPPRTAGGRAVAIAWAGPLTLPGVAIALVSGSRPRWSAEHACWVATGVRGLSSLALRGVGADANTIGMVVLCRHERPPAGLLAHEVVHVRQAERLGPALLPLYLWLAAVHGYRDHPLERAARRGARRSG